MRLIQILKQTLKMKYLSGYILLFLAALLSNGCSENSGSVSTDAYPLSVSSVSLSGVQTRSTTSLTTEGATISVSTLSSGVVSGTSQYAYTGGAWSTASGCSGLVVPDGTALCAYYPYTSGITDKTAIPLCSAKYDTAKDLSYAYSTAATDVAHGTSRATFALQHAYARLTFNFSCAGSYTGSKSIGDIIISNPGILSGASLNITRAAGEYSSKVVGNVAFNAGITDFTTTSSTSVLMVPTDALSGDISMLIQVGSNYKRLTLPATLFANSKLEAGVNYQLPVNVTESSTLSLSSDDVQTIDWVVPSPVSNVLTDLPESNCYIVSPGSTILVPVSRASRGNSANFSTTDDFTTGLLWSDVSANHVTATAIGRYIKVVAGNTEGNSVIYAKKKSTGNIVWSWHIWVTKYNPGTTANTGVNATTYSFNNNLWMDRNLGATSIYSGEAIGLLYQWGRKDPFPGSSTYNGNAEPALYGEQTVITNASVTSDQNLSNTIMHPLMFYFGSDNNYDDWYSVSNIHNDKLWYNDTSAKTIYDPCPLGWRVPYFTGDFSSLLGPTSPWTGLSPSSGTWGHGYLFDNSPNVGFYPAAGFRNHGNLSFVGVNGYYWSASVSSVRNYAYDFCIGSPESYTTNTSGYSCRSNAYSVRCVKE
jgi:uncharacterized protein (TIGR02145 family)